MKFFRVVDIKLQMNKFLKILHKLYQFQASQNTTRKYAMENMLCIECIIRFILIMCRAVFTKFQKT